MQSVYICAPLGGDVEGNLDRAKQYAEYALRCGTAPVVPHFYAFCLNDADPADREIGITAGLQLLSRCDALWMFGDKVAPGMKTELEFCRSYGIPCRHVTDEEMALNGIKGEIHEETLAL